MPPAIFRALLLAAAGDTHADFIAGDLHEEFLYLCETRGPGAGKRWYAFQVLRSLPELLRLRVRSGELAHLLGAVFAAAAPLLVLDRLWCFLYSSIPLKDGVGRAPEFLAANLVALCIGSAMAGGLARRKHAGLLVAATMMGAAAGLWGSVGAAPVVYAIAALVAAPVSSLAASARRRAR